jgi:hypothetical protein
MPHLTSMGHISPLTPMRQSRTCAVGQASNIGLRDKAANGADTWDGGVNATKGQ